jgi:hypothetical protein
MRLVVPSRRYLPSYVAALEAGWSPDNLRGLAAEEQLAAIARDARRVPGLVRRPRSPRAPVKLPDGTTAPRIPGIGRWMGTANSAAASAFAGSPALRSCRSMCSATSASPVVP